MLEAFQIIKRRRVIPKDTKDNFSPLVFLKSMWVVWKKGLSNGLIYRLLKVWYFIYWPLVIKSLALSFEMKGKQSTSGPIVSPTILYQLGPWISWDTVCGKCRKQILVCEIFFLSTSLQIPNQANITFEVLSEVFTKIWKTSSVIRRNYLIFFRVLRDTLTVIQLPLWLFLSGMRMFMASTITVMEG